MTFFRTPLFRTPLYRTPFFGGVGTPAGHARGGDGGSDDAKHPRRAQRRYPLRSEEELEYSRKLEREREERELARDEEAAVLAIILALEE
jgi:hypothetical protein